MTRKHISSKIHKIKPKRPILTRLWFWITILCVIIVFGAAYLLLFYPGIQIKNIVISGNEKVATQDLQNIISDYSNTGLVNLGSLKIVSRSIFLINDVQVNKAVLERFPEIEKLAVSKNFPQTINVTVTERLPLGLYCSTDRHCFSIDQEGVIFEAVKNPPAGETIVRQILDNGQIFSGQEVVSKNIISAIYKIQKMLKDNFKINLAEALVSSPVRLDVTTGEKWKIYFDLNAGSDINSQIQKLTLLLGGGMSPDSRKNLRYIDLRPKDRAIICDNATCGGK